MMEPNKIYCGDCLELFPQVENNTIDLIVTSPPYNVGIKYDSYSDDIPREDYYSWCRKWIKECYRILKPDGRFCLNHYLSCGTSKIRFSPSKDLHSICMQEGFKHHGDAVWMDVTLIKRTAWGSWLSASAPYVNSPFETIEIMYKDHWKKDTKGVSTITKEEFMEATSGVWKITPEKKRNGCPAPFPVALPKRCINLLTFVGDTVLDPFSGSGSTCVAAKEAGRKYIGFDLSPNYCKSARERVGQSVLL